MDEEGDALESILNEVAEQVVAGETVDPFEVIERHPEKAEAIRRAFPRLLKLIRALGGEAPGLQPAPDDRAPAGWREVRQLQRGGQGRVLLVEEVATGRRAAYKLIDQGDEGALREALAYDRLREAENPALVHVHRVYTSGILMEYLQGEELWEFVDPDERPGDGAVRRLGDALEANGDLYARVARAFVSPARGLQRLHEKGVLHRDLKPQNVKVEQGRGLVLFDLGLARVEGLQTISDPDSVLGTIPFLATEALPGSETSFSAGTDVYGLGATLYTILTNRTPHEGKDYVECLEAAQKKTPQPVASYNPDVPRGLAAIVEHAMAREPEERYGTALELAQDLERFAAGQTPWAELGLEALARRRRKRRRVAILSAAALLLVGLGVWGLVRGIEEAERAGAVERRLAAAVPLLAERRAPEALAEVEEAIAVPCEGWEETIACMRARSAALRAMGRYEDDLTQWGTRLQLRDAHDDRDALHEGMAATLHEDANHEGAVRILDRVEGELSTPAHEVLLDSLLRLGLVDEAHALMAERGDEGGRRLLDRFGRRVTVRVPGLWSVAAVPLPGGETVLIAATREGAFFRIHPERPPEQQCEEVAWDVPTVHKPLMRFLGTPGELSVAAVEEDRSSYVAVLRVGEREPVREWRRLRRGVQHRDLDVDGDGVREDVLIFDYPGRGIEVHGAEGEWDAGRMGTLAELDASNTDVRDAVVVRDEEDGPPLLVVATGGWAQSWAYRLLAFRWTPSAGLQLVAQRIVGEITGLVALDRGASVPPDLFVLTSNKVNAQYASWYAEFAQPGLHRVRLPDLATELVSGSRQTGHFDAAGELRTSTPTWWPGRASAVSTSDSERAIAHVSGPRSPDSYVHFVELSWTSADGARALALQLGKTTARRPVQGELLRELRGRELAICQLEEVVILGRREPGAPEGRVWRDLPFLGGERGTAVPSLVEELTDQGYYEAAARIVEDLAKRALRTPEGAALWEESIEAWLRAGHLEEAARALSTLREAYDPGSGTVAYWSARLAELGGRLADAMSLYGLVARAPGVSADHVEDARARGRGLAKLMRRSTSKQFAFAGMSEREELPLGWHIADPRHVKVEPGHGLEGVFATERHNAIECAIDVDELTAFRTKFRVTRRAQDWDASLNVGVFRNRGESGRAVEGAYIVLQNDDAGPRLARVRHVEESEYDKLSTLTGGDSYELAWDRPLDLELAYRRDELVLRATCRDARTQQVLSRGSVRLHAPLPGGRYGIGVRCDPDGVERPCETRFVLHSVEVEVAGDVAWVVEDQTADVRSPTLQAVQDAWRAWNAGDETVALQHWQRAVSGEESVPELLVGPFAHPMAEFLAFLPAQGGESVVENLRRLAADSAIPRQDPELCVELLSGRPDLDEESRAALREALVRIGRTAEAYALAGGEAGPVLGEAGTPGEELRVAANALRGLRPAAALATLDRLLAAAPPIRVRTRALRLLARANVMRGDEAKAREAIGELAAVEAFEVESLKDDPDLRRFLQAER